MPSDVRIVLLREVGNQRKNTEIAENAHQDVLWFVIGTGHVRAFLGVGDWQKYSGQVACTPFHATAVAQRNRLAHFFLEIVFCVCVS